jgi:hypothetical protein
VNRFTIVWGLRVVFDIRQHRDLDRSELRYLVARVTADPERCRQSISSAEELRPVEAAW